MNLRNPIHALAIGLGLSVAINLIGVGFLLSFVLFRPPPPPPGPFGEHMLERLARRLPPEDGAKLLALIAKGHTAEKAAEQEMTTASQALREAILADPYDPAKAAAAGAAIHKAAMAIGADYQATILTAAGEMSATGRKALADILPPPGRMGPGPGPARQILMIAPPPGTPGAPPMQPPPQ
jgi:hypothetical protein